MGFPFYKQQSLLKYGKLKKTPNFYLFCEFAYIFKTKKFIKWLLNAFKAFNLQTKVKKSIMPISALPTFLTNNNIIELTKKKIADLRLVWSTSQTGFKGLK